MLLIFKHKITVVVTISSNSFAQSLRLPLPQLESTGNFELMKIYLELEFKFRSVYSNFFDCNNFFKIFKTRFLTVTSGLLQKKWVSLHGATSHPLYSYLPLVF